MLILNRSEKSQTVGFQWREEDVVDPHFPVTGQKYTPRFKDSRYQWQELWSGEVGTTEKPLEEIMEPHSVKVYRLVKDTLSADQLP